ncbi:MAG: hypothetical protein SXQ77_13520 [Halobacteria archaeon]|nr:hypothetical protein [Halobacteria archaeon]
MAYFFGLFSGLFFYFTEEDNKFIRFHALQSILLAIAIPVVFIGLTIFQMILFAIPRIGGIIGLLFSLIWLVFWFGMFVLWLFLMYKAYSGEKFKLPVIGNIAEDNA